MGNCLHLDCNPDIPVPTPVPLPPCEDGEACKEVTDAGCVVYTNEALPSVNVLTNDRLNDIIRKWAHTVLAGTQAVSKDSTLTTNILGNGTGPMPLKVDVRVSSSPENLLKVVNEVDDTDVLRTGLEVLLTDEVIGLIISRIVASDELTLQFCELVRPCLDNSCGLATGLEATPAYNS
jgi:hypothetical protein